MKLVKESLSEYSYFDERRPYSEEKIYQEYAEGMEKKLNMLSDEDYEKFTSDALLIFNQENYTDEIDEYDWAELMVRMPSVAYKLEDELDELLNK